jgi:hypothetical protein
MLVTTSRPIYEENSNANGKKKPRTGKFRKKLATGFQKGYAKVKEAGALPVIENLLGLGMGSGTTPTGADLPSSTPIDTPPPTTMSTTTKVVIGVLVLGAVVGAVYYFNKNKSVKGKPSVKIVK